MDYYIDEGLANTYNYSLEYPLIHVCDSIDTIAKILEKGFRFSYCTEMLEDEKRNVVFSYPIISFSDLCWDKAIFILRSYGHSSIAMKKSWAIKNKLSPVLYFERNSELTKILIEGFDDLTNVPIEDIKSSINGQLLSKTNKYYKHIMEIASYSKNFYGQLIRQNKVIDNNYCFGCESEWRIVLRNDTIEPFIARNDNKNSANNLAHNYYLKFDFDDIEYFVIETQYEEKVLKEKLKFLYNKTDKDVNNIKFYYDKSRHSFDEF
ncbi:abortive infection system antitoxin AbiGi family protein [Aquirufa sp. ROCK2-A2]